MYEAFDQFLQVSTWHTRHPIDEQRFLDALKQVVRNHDFNPDEMGAYMRKQARGLRKEAVDEAVEHYVCEAWAVKRYLHGAVPPIL